MPSNIVNLNELVPGIEGKTFKITLADGEEQSYYVPGDLDTETVFEFLALFEDMVRFQEKITELRTQASEDENADVSVLLNHQTDALRELTEKIREKLLAVFQIADPDLKVLPFGNATIMVVLGEVLEMMGLAGSGEDLPEPEEKVDPPTRRVPQDRKPKAARRRTGARTTTTRTKRAT